MPLERPNSTYGKLYIFGKKRSSSFRKCIVCHGYEGYVSLVVNTTSSIYPIFQRLLGPFLQIRNHMVTHLTIWLAETEKALSAREDLTWTLFPLMNNLPSPNLLPFFLSLVRGESTLGLDELSLGVIDCDRLPGPLPVRWQSKMVFFSK